MVPFLLISSWSQNANTFAYNVYSARIAHNKTDVAQTIEEAYLICYVFYYDLFSWKLFNHNLAFGLSTILLANKL